MVKGLVQVWTDGSCNNATNTNGGYGIIMTYKNHYQEISGGSYYNTTSQRMELMAVIVVLEELKPGYKIQIHTDAQYISNAINGKWVFRWESQAFQRRPNADLWKRLLKAYRRFPKGDISIVWVRGHNGNENNVKADKLARTGGSKIIKQPDLDEVRK